MEQCIFYQNSEKSAPCFYFSQEMQGKQEQQLQLQERVCVCENQKLMWQEKAIIT